jgi:hypothetical protein
MCDPSRFDDLHLFTAWDDRVLRAYMRRVFGPRRHPTWAAKILVRYDENMKRASAFYEMKAREERRRQNELWLLANQQGAYKL